MPAAICGLGTKPLAPAAFGNILKRFQIVHFDEVRVGNGDDTFFPHLRERPANRFVREAEMIGDINPRHRNGNMRASTFRFSGLAEFQEEGCNLLDRRFPSEQHELPLGGTKLFGDLAKHELLQHMIALDLFIEIPAANSDQFDIGHHLGIVRIDITRRKSKVLTGPAKPADLPAPVRHQAVDAQRAAFDFEDSIRVVTFPDETFLGDVSLNGSQYVAQIIVRRKADALRIYCGVNIVLS